MVFLKSNHEVGEDRDVKRGEGGMRGRWIWAKYMLQNCQWVDKIILDVKNHRTGFDHRIYWQRSLHVMYIVTAHSLIHNSY